MSLTEQIRAALEAGTGGVDDSPDLFARVQSSIEEDRRLRRQKRARVGASACLAGAAVSAAVATTERRQGDLIMDWWILEVVWFVAMVGLAVWLGPFIRRFGKAYAADVFRANPRTGKSFIVLMDVAYYLIFFAYILFAVKFEPDGDWENTVNAAQLQGTTVRVGGILLIVGLLHGLNVLTLPIMGRIFTLNRRLDEDAVGADR
ncbi:MAG: hypothetical protein GWN79_15385 [Actinobacteria bacterium]|nr:hypothetical protein [Actinomycetota bacterium]NIS33159.1 hypothetical protein [Actinomycetota bacterium]NIT96683.1 hypothetical protein [Actinomycetota bacterium]NIU20376.1 hypothetical protein [Actinomycetota bacterium]NIU68076.1 hypothetical protein [Actinomycetota bacterium]